MAYLGTFTSGQVLTAAELNSLNALTYYQTVVTSLSFTSGASTTVSWAAGDLQIDTGGWFNTTTSRFTPTIAGYYSVTCNLNFTANAGAIAWLLLSKNATAIARHTSNLATSGATSGLSVSTIIYLNGTTDYMIASGLQSSGGAVTSTSRNFSAYLLRK